MQSVEKQQIYIIDDDRDVLITLEAVLSARGYGVQKFVSALHFLANCDTGRESCVLADIRMPGMDGLQLQEQILLREIPASTIVITGHADVTLAVRAMKAGAYDLLEKPFNNQKLLDLLPGAFAAAAEKLRRLNAALHARSLIASLSPRERQVAELVAEGLSNKLIADRLALSSRTIELHRANAMEKLGATNAAGLVQILLDGRTAGAPQPW